MLIVLSVGFLAQRHEAETAHVRELSGRIVHAQELAEHHELSASAHLHGREAHRHSGDCSLLALAHERGTIATAPVAIAAAAATYTLPAAELHDVVVARAAYRIAPKTSPPSA